jgi:hypothetical protein
MVHMAYFAPYIAGGSLLANTMATILWQSRAAHNAYQRTVLEHKLQDRRAAAKEFSDGFGGSLYLLNDFLIHRLWIAHHRTEASYVYPDGRDFASERTYFEVSGSRLFTRPIPESLTARVAMTFSSAAVQSEAHKLTEALTKMAFDDDEKVLETDFQAANHYDKIIASMQSEITSIESRWESAK